ncbi:SpoIIE family protein phosphatase [Candidatus Gracilibacteria bacterium]|nr:SpoIIE family protein phosphatase [Candidatus Gracilibacteria bacterium]
MNYLKKFFNFYINVLILIIIISSIGLFYYFKKDILINFNKDDYLLFIGVFLIQYILIIFIINISFYTPIEELKRQVLNFLSGNNKGDKLKIKTDFINPNIKISLIFFDNILNSLKNIKDEFLSGKAIKGEIQLAMELQEKLLYKKLEEVPSLDIIAKSKPAGEIGGDSYDIIKGQDSNYYIYAGDATGHGVGAGFVMVMVNALVSGFSKIYKKGSEILANTNEVLKPRVKSNILMTLLLVRWDELNKRLFMTGAGHEYLIIYKHSLNKCFKIKSGGLALGMTKNIHKILKEQEIKFEKNDIVVLYTDGITEMLNQNKKDGNEEMFGEQRLMDSILKSPILPGLGIKTATGVFNNLTIDISKFMGYKYRQFDDITLVVIHYKGDQKIEQDFPKEIPNDFITEWNWD